MLGLILQTWLLIIAHKVERYPLKNKTLLTVKMRKLQRTLKAVLRGDFQTRGKHKKLIKGK